ncbi:DUF3307 domain-containing protein [Roseivivax sp.]
MIETFAALFLAHVVADFVIQTNWMAANKARPGVLVLHSALVLLTAQAATGQIAAPALLALAAAHLVIDVAKSRAGPGLGPFLWDQAAHLASLLAVAAYAPDLWQTGLWAGEPRLPTLMLFVAGGIYAIRVGGFAVGALVSGWDTSDLPDSLPGAGAIIGQLERAMIYILVLIGEPAAIGFLIAAKSILRFDAARDNRTAEYVITGTLASFAWALLVAYGTAHLLSALPPLEFAP